MDDYEYRKGENEKEYKWCFYNVLKYLKEDREIYNKAGLYWLDDQRGATLMSMIRDEIQNRLIDALTHQGFSEATRIASQGGAVFVDFEPKLENDSLISGLYKRFLIWLKSH
jgi:hypothetical protein